MSVYDIEIPVPDQEPLTAYFVRRQRAPRPRSLAGVLYLHWFEPGQPNQNRGEFLAEALDLAGRGAVALLPQLRFPWTGEPVGDARDRRAVVGQFDAVRRAYAALVAQPAVNIGRTAVVGHDYGGMYGAMLAQADRRIRAGVFMAIDSTWANWFDTYWLKLPEDRKPLYRALFAGLDPVDNVDRLGGAAYFQWGSHDPFGTEGVRDALAAANPEARVTLYHPSGHFLTQQALDERTAWLAERLQLSG